MTDGISRSSFLSRARGLVLAALGTTVLGKAASAADAPAAKAAGKHYTMVVLTNATPGKDKEFNEWYNGQHIPDVLKVPGFVAAQRFKMATKPLSDKPFQYFARYDLETNDAQAAVDELIRRYSTGDGMSSSDAMDKTSYFGIYEAITPTKHGKKA